MAMTKRLDFLVVGVQKSATTTLDQYLRSHPEIEMPRGKKELHYFDVVKNFSKGVDFYHPYFLGADFKKKWGECTPIYCYWKGVIEKIYQYNPNIKLIMVLRNPIERAYSHWNMEFTHKRENLSFYKAISREESRLANELNNQHRVYSYLSRGRYLAQIKRILEFFDRNNLLILKMDDLVKKPQKSIDKISEFIGVSNYTIKNSICAYRGDYRQQMSKEEKLFLRQFFYEEILSLESFLGWDCSEWLEF